MKSKYLFQIVAVLAILVSALGTSQSAYASPQQAVQIVMRDLTYWNAVYPGFVDASRYEKWPLELAETHHFIVTAAPVSGDLTPLLLLLDTSGNEISRATGSLTSTQPVGSYYIQVQPETGGGTYNMTIREVVVVPSVSTVVNPSTIDVGQSSVATVSLNNVPAEGYTSAEFTCTYNPALVEVSNIADAGLFGADAAVAINGPQNGSFIFAVAGSNGNKATASGAAFTFSLKGLAAGDVVIECKARVSTDGNVLTDIAFTPITLTVKDVVVVVPDGTLTGQVVASKPVTVKLYKADNSVAATVAANADGTFSVAAPAGTYTVTASADGFLGAQGSSTLTSGNTSTMPNVSLLAGDIDNNGVIDQYDAMTIGMSYNTATPVAADLNNDSTINVLDLQLLANNYHKAGAVAWQ
jgi:hypothetical protein